MEEMDCNDLRKACSSLAVSAGRKRVLAVIEFAAMCATNVSTALDPLIVRLRDGGDVAGSKMRTNQSVIAALRAVEASESIAPVTVAMRAIENMPNVILFRRELWRELLRTIALFIGGGFADLAEAAWAARNKVRHTGRQMSQRSVSRTLLIKGLEFDHAIVLDAGPLNAKELYVALSRGSRTLTVLSEQPVVRKHPPAIYIGSSRDRVGDFVISVI